MANTSPGTPATDRSTLPTLGADRFCLDATGGPVHPAALETMRAAWERGWADPRRLHAEGRTARRLLDQAREVLAAGLGVRPDELVFTAGGPAALRLGLEGLRYAARRRGARVVASAVEHSAILLGAQYAADQAGDPALAAEVAVDRFGRVDLDAWRAAVQEPGTVAAALQHANGEVGTIQPIAAAHEICRSGGIPLLVDATASLGRAPVPTHFDVLAGDARSWGGPAGVGVLVLPAGTRWRPDAPAAEVEGGRSLVDPVVPLVLGAAQAWQELAADTSEAQGARELIERIRAAAASVPETDVVGDPLERLPHVLTFSCLLADGEALVAELDRRGFAVASGSACTSVTLRPSHVLAAMGVLTHGNVRITLPTRSVAPDREQGVQRLCAQLPAAVAAVRAQVVGR